jgi:hypothetical protein
VPSSRQLQVPPCAPWAFPHFRARLGTSAFPWVVGLPAGVPVVPPYPRPWGNPWDLPRSRLGLADVPRSSTPVRGREPWPGGLLGSGLPCLGACRPSPLHLDTGAQSLPACALRPVLSLCTLRRRRYRRRRHTRSPVSGQDFWGSVLPSADRAELCSAHPRPYDLPCAHIKKSDDVDNICAKINTFWHKRVPCKSYQRSH